MIIKTVSFFFRISFFVPSFAENYTNVAVERLANSRMVNHFAAVVFYGRGIYLPGFGRWRGRTRTALVVYILQGLKNESLKLSNANSGEKAKLLCRSYGTLNATTFIFYQPCALNRA